HEPAVHTHRCGRCAGLLGCLDYVVLSRSERKSDLPGGFRPHVYRLPDLRRAQSAHRVRADRERRFHDTLPLQRGRPTLLEEGRHERGGLLRARRAADGGRDDGKRRRRPLKSTKGRFTERSGVNIIAGGRVIGRRQGSTKSFYLTDHLGSTRAVFTSAGVVQEVYDYYPFGLVMPGRTLVSGTGTKEQFTGK